LSTICQVELRDIKQDWPLLNPQNSFSTQDQHSSVHIACL
jgi:hypothetical protein